MTALPLLDTEAPQRPSRHDAFLPGPLPHDSLGDLVWLAAQSCDAAIGRVSLVPNVRSWLRSLVGLGAVEALREGTFCAHAIAGTDLFIVPDATADERFCCHPDVNGPAGIRFYAGVPLTLPTGQVVGTLSVSDRVPRELTAPQQGALRTLGRLVLAQLMMRRQIEQLKSQARDEGRFRALFEQSSDGHLIIDPQANSIIDCNHAAVAMLRCRDRDEVLAMLPSELSPEFQPDGRRSREKGAELESAWRDGPHRFDWVYRRADGDELQVEVTVTPVEVAGRPVLLATWHDLTDRKRAEDAQRETEAQFRAFLDNSPTIAFVKDDSGRYVYYNEPFCRRFNLRQGDWLGKTDFEVWPREVAQQFHDHDRAAMWLGGPLRVTETTPEPDGSVSHWQMHKYPFRDAAGRRYLAGMAVDVTAEKKAEVALRESEERYRSTVDRLAEGVFLVDPATGRFVEANAAVLGMLGYTQEEFLRLDPFETAAGETRDVYERNIRDMQEVLRHEGRCDLGQRLFRRKDGSSVPVSVQVSVAKQGRTELHVVIVRDVTEELAYQERLFEYQSELEDANARLRLLAVTDALTGARNRAAFNEKLAEEYARAARHGHPLSVILVDVDHFKLFNDTHGHPAGDEVLKAVARLLQRTVRSTDFVARYGGEEFVVLLPDTDVSGATVLAERCRRAVSGASWERRCVTISVGVATLTADTKDAAELVRVADEALYCSKRGGRNRVTHGGGKGTVPLLTHRA